MKRSPMTSVQRIRVRTTRAILLLTMVACSKTADTPAPANSGPALPDGKNPTTLVAALDSATMLKMEQRLGSWQDADASSTWRAMVSGGKVRLIDESMKVGESSSRRITHFFTEDGAPAAYYEFRIQTVNSTNRPPSRQFVLFKLEFMGDSLSKTEKTVDGEVEPIQKFEIETARRHSQTLLELARSAPVTTPAKP